MRSILNAIVLMFMGIIIMIQQGENDLLINEYKGLAVVCLMCIIGSILVMLADTFEITLRRAA